MRIDVCMTAVRRPDLLAETLASFQDNVFSNFTIGSVLVNIDPAFGTKSDEDACEALLRCYFDAVQIRKPETPSFGAAVKWLWSSASKNVLFHMEDDWICLDRITPDDVSHFFQSGYGAVAPLTVEHHWKRRYPYLTNKQEWFRLFGKTIYRRVPALGTSPKFIQAEYATAVAQLLIPHLDPEKQQDISVNPSLASLVQSKKCAVLTREKRTPMIKDIGRSWAQREGVTKTVSKGQSIWSNDESSA